MFLEIQLVPAHLVPKGMQRVKVVEALAPSRSMIPKALTISARRLEQHLWEAWYLPIRFWQRAPIIPAIEHSLFWRDNRGESIYQWVRATEIVFDGTNPSTRDLGPDVRIVAADKFPHDHNLANAQKFKFVRRIFYLDASDPLDGLYQPHPDTTCVSPRGHRSRCPQVDEQSLEHARKQSRDYNAETEAMTKGMVRSTVGNWVTPEQFAAELEYQKQSRHF
jgi:hypothetical protein